MDNENILLMFLSYVRIVGDGTVSKTACEQLGDEPVEITNESAVRYLIKNGVNLSKIFILASKGVRQNISGYGEEITHLEYFRRRMGKFLDVENCITPETIFNYDEDGKGADNLKGVAEMAQRIQNYSAGKNVCLYADLTGGMRHVIMTMLNVIRLLEYSGVKIGQLLYANYSGKIEVEEVKNIYDLFQLISGVEEFINFGSVEALKKYYAANSVQSDSLKNLIKAMENFAESIKLCRYGQFKDAIKNLHDALNDYSFDADNLNDILMARLIDKIREKYSPLVATRGENDIKIIRWCIENGYLQQALTLYTERVPEYLGAKFISQDEKIKAKLERKIENDDRNYFFYLLVVHMSDDDAFKAEESAVKSFAAKLSNNYFNLIRNDAVTSIKKNTFNYAAWKEKIFAGKQLPPLVGRADLFKDESKLRLQLETLNTIYQNPQLLAELDAPALEPIRAFLEDAKTKFEPQDDVLRLRKKLFNNLSNAELTKYFQPLKVESRITRLRFMLRENIFRVKIPAEKFLSIMRKYFLLKDERNHCNHARNDIGEFSTAQELKIFMERGIDEIESFAK